MSAGEHSKSKKKPKNFDANFHRILQKSFPDWERRIEYEQRQRKLYESAQNKLKMSPIGISSSDKLFSPEEKDAIAYFQGTGFYADCQRLEKKYSKILIDIEILRDSIKKQKSIYELRLHALKKELANSE